MSLIEYQELEFVFRFVFIVGKWNIIIIISHYNAEKKQHN